MQRSAAGGVAAWLILPMLVAVACGDPPAAPTPVEPDEPPTAPVTTTGPPFEGTVFISPHVITEADATKLTGIAYSGRGQRSVFDRRVDDWVTVNAYLFDVRYAWGNVEYQVNPEFGSRAAARAEVDTYAPALGRLPAFLLTNARVVQINDGTALFGGNPNGSFLIHAGEGRVYIRDGFLEEILFHEAAHVSLDTTHAAAPDWLAAQQADGAFISTYARDQPQREDLAESVLPWWAVRHRPAGLAVSDRQVIERTIPNRMAYFDREF